MSGKPQGRKPRSRKALSVPAPRINRHRRSDQWRFVIAGRGVATVSGKSHRLKPYSPYFVQRDPHARLSRYLNRVN
jgi:hypothetical protein